MVSEPEFFFEEPRCANGAQLAVCHDSNFLAQQVCLVHEMSGEQNRTPSNGFKQDKEQHALLSWVNTVGIVGIVGKHPKLACCTVWHPFC